MTVNAYPTGYHSNQQGTNHGINYDWDFNSSSCGMNEGIVHNGGHSGLVRISMCIMSKYTNDIYAETFTYYSVTKGINSWQPVSTGLLSSFSPSNRFDYDSVHLLFCISRSPHFTDSILSACTHHKILLQSSAPAHFEWSPRNASQDSHSCNQPASQAMI